MVRKLNSHISCMRNDFKSEFAKNIKHFEICISMLLINLENLEIIIILFV